MRKTPAFILVALVAVGAIVYLTRDADVAREIDINALARRQAERQTERLKQEEFEKTDLAALAKKGLGQAVPGDLVSELDRDSSFWFVGKPGSEMGVQIPFEPGKRPHPPSTAEPLHPNPGYLGADACRSCHEEKHKTFVETAHHRTSRLALAGNVSGSFEPGKNRMRTIDPNVFFTMVERDGELFQQVSFFDWKFEVPFHLIMGSSKMAESYLFWHGDRLYQMNCTYLTDADAWINSPGFLDGDAIYVREIPSGCLDCHVTYADYRQPANHYTPSTLILGVSCERCHGPGKQHVDFHAANSDETEARHITVPSKLPRQQEMDVCGQCHTGQKAPKHDIAFQFRPGDRLEDHYEPVDDHDESPNSVHTSDQIDRLMMSECFKQSEMACIECHDPHQNERGQTAVFSERCLKCHESEHCGMNEKLGPRLSSNCIDCHMPLRATANLRVETLEGQIFPPLRDHYIRVDQDATAEYMSTLEPENN